MAFYIMIRILANEALSFLVSTDTDALYLLIFWRVLLRNGAIHQSVETDKLKFGSSSKPKDATLKQPIKLLRIISGFYGKKRVYKSIPELASII